LHDLLPHGQRLVPDVELTCNHISDSVGVQNFPGSLTDAEHYLRSADIPLKPKVAGDLLE
jgi:hypothetical protein